jgi:hypothetical protein
VDRNSISASYKGRIEMSGFWENGNVGLSTGQVTWSYGVTETPYMTLDVGKHPKKVKPIIVFNPIGENSNMNAYVQDITFDETNDYWKWKAGFSAGNWGFKGPVLASYVIISMWA